jgi:DNA-binding HxlR family transcriptional regulator
MAITLTDEMLEILQGLEKGEAKMFLKGIQLAQGMGEGKQAAKEEAELAAKRKAPAKERVHSATYRRNRGAQAEILRALFTGPASYIQLQEALRYGREVVTHTLSRLEGEGKVVMLKLATGGAAWQLTPAGRQLAGYYVANPGLKVLNKQHKEKLAKEKAG